MTFELKPTVIMSDVSDTDDGESEKDGHKPVPETNRRVLMRNLIAFWLFGLCNNYAYVIMLSAAYDILETQTTTPTPTLMTIPTVPWQNLTDSTISTTPQNPYDCNEASTAIILLANIIPCLIIKYTSPWFAELLPFDVRIAMYVLCTSASFIIVALSHNVALSLIGVACASAASGLGEFSFLSLAAFYEKNVVSTWSSGTGAAGLFGALSYAGLTAAGMSPRNTILVMLTVPVVLAVSYWILLVRWPDVHNCAWGRRSVHQYAPPVESGTETGVITHLSLREKIEVIKGVLYLIIPLSLVYMAEYFINQGLFELVHFQGIWLSHQEQYRWYQVTYQLGVFISRSSVNVVVIRKTWILAVLQVANVLIFVTELFYFYIPSIYIVFVLILYEGLIGGAAYVNTFYIIREEVSSQWKEFAMGVTAVSDSTGIALAAAIAVPVHTFFCNRVVY